MIQATSVNYSNLVFDRLFRRHLAINLLPLYKKHKICRTHFTAGYFQPLENIMKLNCKLYFLLAVLCISPLVSLHAQNWQWAKSFGDDQPQTSTSVTTDKWGNIYLTGWFQSRILNIGAFTLYGTFSKDMFLVKYSPSGTVLWATSAGGYYDDYANCVSADSFGNVYVTGNFNSSTIGFGSDTLTNPDPGSPALFVVKYDSAGNTIWAHTAISHSSETANSITADPTGNVYVTGYFRDTLTFGSIALSAPDYGGDLFIAKYDSAGHVIWAKSVSDSLYDVIAYSVAADRFGHIFIAGTFNSPELTIGTAHLTTTSDESMFIVKYDTAGNFMWARNAGDSLTTIPNTIAADRQGNVLVSGYFTGATLRFDTTVLSLYSAENMFVAKYDFSGNIKWAKCASAAYCFGTGVATDDSCNVYTTGYYQSDSIVFGSTVLYSGGGFNAYIAKYDSSGNVVWADGPTGTTDYNESTAIAVDGQANVYATGTLLDNATFGSTVLYSTGNTDIYLSKYKPLAAISLSANQISTPTAGMLLSPNPATGILYIQSATQPIRQLTITNLTGQTVYAHEYNTETVQVNVATLPPGVYFVKVNGAEVKKFVKE